MQMKYVSLSRWLVFKRDVKYNSAPRGNIKDREAGFVLFRDYFII